MTVTRYNKAQFPYEWPLAYREDPVSGLGRGRCGGLGLGSRLGHDVEGGTLGQILCGSLALRCTVMGGILGRPRGRSAMRVAFCNAVAGLVVRSVEQTMHSSRAVMSEIPTRNRGDAQDLHALVR